MLALCLASACGGGGGGGIGDPDVPDPVDGLEVHDPGRLPDPLASEFLVTPAFGTPADGVTTVSIEATLVNRRGFAIRNAVIQIEVSGAGNVLQPLPPTDASGHTSGTLASFAGELKTISARTGSGGEWTGLGPRTAEFLQIPAETYFVRASGSDANTGRSPREPWQTLAHALEHAGPGATIHVGAGIQSGPLTIRHDARDARPLYVAGDPSGRMTGDAGEVVIEAGGSPHALGVLDARGVVLRGLTLRGAQSGLRIASSSDVRVLGCVLRENDLGLDAEDVQDLVVQDCRIDSCHLDGLRLANVRGARIENNLIYANGQSGLVLAAPGEATVVRYNTFYANAGPHLREDVKGGSGWIEENILADGLTEPVSLPWGSSYLSADNLVWGHPIERTERTPSGYFEADPLIADPDGADGVLGGPGAADDDFRLRPQSIAIDLGLRLARDVVLASQESMATRSSRTDLALEASEVDGAATNLGFHVAPEPPAFESLPVGGVRLVHAVPSDVRSHPRAWARATPGASSATPGPVLEGEVVFLEQRLSPLATREELLAAQVDTGTQGRIVVRHWDGRRWNEPALAPFLDGIPRAEIADRRFDLEYETLSGRALFVGVDALGGPSFRILERGAWSLEQPVWVSDAGVRVSWTGRVRWVELVARGGSNELALVTLDDQRDLYVTLWNGETFGAPTLLEANTLFLPSWRPFSAAYETLSGDLLVAWGFSVFAEQTRWATLEHASGRWITGQHPSSDAIGANIVFASDPVSDRIVMAQSEGNSDNDITVSIWTGSEWVDTAELTLSGPIENRLLEAVWIGRTGMACVVFRRFGLVGSFNAALLLPTGWRIQPDVRLPGVEKAAQVRLVSLPDDDQMVGLVLDFFGELHEFRFDGAAFSLLNGGEPLVTGFDPLAAGRPFDLAVGPAAH